MKEFDQLCREFEQLDPLTYGVLLAEKAADIFPALALVTGSEEEGASLFATFILGAVAADGKLSEEEYALVYPMFHAFFGEEADYEACKKAVRSMRAEKKDLKETVDAIVDLMGLLSEELKDEIVLVCLMICAIDGKVSLSEKNWIKKLVR